MNLYIQPIQSNTNKQNKKYQIQTAPVQDKPLCSIVEYCSGSEHCWMWKDEASRELC